MIELDADKMMLKGAEYLMPVLQPLGFEFSIVKSGVSCGGPFCEAEFSLGPRRIELHFRRQLGLVRYHIGNVNASHKSYIQALSAETESQYLQIYHDPMDGFRRLAHDFALIRSDYMENEAQILIKAAEAERRWNAEQNKRMMVFYSGDSRTKSKARDAFREGKYDAVVKLLNKLQYPNDLTLAEQKMLAIAHRKLKTR